jgi:hypothetical protein
MRALEGNAMARCIDDLPVAELKALLAMDPAELPEPGPAAILDFVDRIGGIENARLAIEMLEAIEADRTS